MEKVKSVEFCCYLVPNPFLSLSFLSKVRSPLPTYIFMSPRCVPKRKVPRAHRLSPLKPRANVNVSFPQIAPVQVSGHSNTEETNARFTV